MGDTVYFLSDRNGPVTLFAYDTKAKSVKQVVANDGLDLKSLSGGAGVLVYEQFGGIYSFDPASGTSTKVPVRIAGDLPATRAHYEKVADKIQGGAVSPSGARAVFEARGEILTVPAEKGDIRNLTRTTAAVERDPAWSPDGKSIAYFSDESGEYALHITDQSGAVPVKKIGLGTPPSFFYGPVWSPDSKKIAYTDKRLNLWYVDVALGTPVKVATDPFEDPSSAFRASW
jgi:tricorn protease